MVHQVGVAVGVYDGENVDAQPPRLGDADVLPPDVDSEDGLGQGGHVPHAGEVLFQPVKGVPHLDALFLGQQAEITLVPLLLEFQHIVDAGADGLEVGQGAAQPPLVDVPHTAAVGFALYHFLGLPLGAHEQDLAAVGNQFHHVFVGIVNHAQRLLQVDNVDAVALGEDVALHGWVPPPGLMPEVDARLQKSLHVDGLPPRRLRGTLRRGPGLLLRLRGPGLGGRGCCRGRFRHRNGGLRRGRLFRRGRFHHRSGGLRRSCLFRWGRFHHRSGGLRRGRLFHRGGRRRFRRAFYHCLFRSLLRLNHPIPAFYLLTGHARDRQTGLGPPCQMAHWETLGVYHSPQSRANATRANF